jgi:two-component system NarL family sensor kinase
MLDEAGLQSALRARLDRYTECTGIAVTLEASELDRLPADVELTIFRVIEEALANVKQHSGSVTACIRIERGVSPTSDVVVRIEDAGGGMPLMVQLEGLIQQATTTITDRGLGLARMRERLRRIGGELEISSESHKTTVWAKLPVSE